MELLSPSPPHHAVGNRFARLLSPMNFTLGFDGEKEKEKSSDGSPLPEIIEEDGGGGGGEKVYVAVGKSIERAVDLLNWTFRKFGNQEIGFVLVHVHQPSPTIPTLLGKLPASQANEEMVSAYRREEKEQMRKLLFNYSSICCRAKVKASTITIENGQVHKGIVELVNRHGIRRLVMGELPDNCLKVKKSSSKASYAAKNAPPFCEIWFVSKGKHVWTREASEGPSFVPPILSPSVDTLAERVRSISFQNRQSDLVYNPAFLGSSSYPAGVLCDGVRNWPQLEPGQLDMALSATQSNFTYSVSHSSSSPNRSSTLSGYTSAEARVSSEYDSKLEEESLYNKIIEATTEAERSKSEALEELLKRIKLESEAMEAINRVKAFEAARARETELRKEVEDAIRSTKREQEKLLDEREEVSRELQRSMRNIAVLDSRAQEATRRQNEAARELRLVHTSLATLRREKQKIQQQKEEAVRWLEQWRSHGQVGPSNFSGVSFVNTSEEFTEFSSSDLQTATCNFSESFKIGQGTYGCVYKGEIQDRSVAIKKLHPLNMQGRLEFQQEAEVLSRLQHPHLVTLIGTCPESWSLVYEYLPNGSIQDHLFRKTNTHPLTWKTRTRIAAEILSALLYLHSKPEKIVHGNLKPENILLDSEFHCKIGDYGICRIVLEETARCPSFRGSTETKSAFPYTDPELQRAGDSTPKSDIYSFGVIILQLLTGRPPVGLASEVRRAVLCGKLASVLDPLAGEWPTFVARRLVDLGLLCCEANSRDRPELKPNVVRELERLHLAEERVVPSFFLCPIHREIMYDPHVAADGFTYEGEALRGWFKNGRGTSPMTNLELSHLHLTPNHALRLAIQDWLCQS